MRKELKYLDYEEAVLKSLDIINPTYLTQNVYLLDSLGKILAQDIVCTKNLPSFNNSAMDGFAIKSSDAGKTLHIKRTILAGQKEDKNFANLNKDECYKIMTGAIVPNDADTIIPIEDCTNITQTSVTIPTNIQKGANLRLKGEEQKEGDVLLKKGEVIDSSSVILLASQGHTVIEVFKDISIAVLSTGDELKEPWETASEDEIYNCNSYGLISLLKEKGFNADYLGVMPDDLQKSKSFIAKLKLSYDVIITTGGISAGDADFTKDAFLHNGLEILFHGVNIKPGKPIMMGKMDQCIVLSIPGNPLTAMINTYLFTIPVLNKLQGGDKFYYDIIIAKNQNEFKVKQGRVNVVLGTYKDGKFYATLENKYGSGMISALNQSNALLISHKETSNIKQNQEVKIITLNSNFINKKINILN